VTKERRLGRGLEALLGRAAAKPEVRAREPSSGIAAVRTRPFDTPPSEEEPESVPASAETSRIELRQRDDEAAESGPLAARAASREDEGTNTCPVSPVVSQETAAARPWSAAAADPPPGPPTRLPLREIESSPFQPRQEFDDDEIQALCDSLRAHGLLQPIVVRRVGGRYQLIAGERRLRAAARAGWTEVPVQVVEADDRLAAELAIVENMQRKDLGPLEKAASFQRYLEQYGCTQEELASRLKLDRSTIANLIR